MADNEFAGSALYAQWIYPGGTVIVSTDCRTFTYNDTGETIDATAGADRSRRTINSFDTGQVTASFLLQSDMGTVTYLAFKRGTKGTLIWGEAGTVAGRPKTILPARVDSATRNVPYNDVVSMDVTWLQDGPRVDGAY